MKNPRNIIATSEILGEIILLLIVASTFSVIFYNVSSLPQLDSPLNVTIIGKTKENTLVLEHQRGAALNLDTKITLNIGGRSETFQIKKYLDAKAQEDGKWNIGERLIYPLSFNTSTIQSHFAASLQAADRESNSLVFMGGFDVYPTTDLGVTLTADNLAPTIGSIVNFTICVTNYEGGTPAVDIQILSRLSKNFSYISNISSAGFYDPATWIWALPSLESGETACLTITARAVLSSTPTQLVMVLDGSGSISSTDWNIMKEGLARAIENDSIFPHDGNVELTVVQFARTYAQTEIAPVQVTKFNYATIGATIRGITQLGRSTPIACGLRLAADQLRTVGGFAVDKRQIITLVTDGVANVYWTSGYSGSSQGYDGWSKGTDRYYTGSASAKSSNNRRGNFITKDLDATGATSITIDFRYRLDDTESDDLYLYYYNGNTYNYITSLGGGAEDTWLHFTHTTTSSQYFKPNFRILLRGGCEVSENVWIDNVVIQTNTKELLNDGFESEYWGENWWNPALKSAEEASTYTVNTLQMVQGYDELNCLGVGVGGMYGGPDNDWLKSKIVWPQPGHLAPPYAAGWVKSITTWQEFEEAICEIFRNYFEFSNSNYVKIISATPFTDPLSGNNEVHIILSPS